MQGHERTVVNRSGGCTHRCARVELLLPDGQRIWAQMTRDEAELDELTEGAIVYARPRRAKVFEANGEPRTEELSAA